MTKIFILIVEVLSIVLNLEGSTIHACTAAVDKMFETQFLVFFYPAVISASVINYVCKPFSMPIG